MKTLNVFNIKLVKTGFQQQKTIAFTPIASVSIRGTSVSGNSSKNDEVFLITFDNFPASDSKKVFCQRDYSYAADH